jgi:citronellol/citronellal dehydrogenase
MRLKDQVVLITGGSRGVGAAVALAVAREGAHVALAGKTVEPHPKLPGTLGEVADQVRALGREALVIQADIRFPEQVTAMVEKTIEHFGRIDALINNAGAIFWGTTTDFPIKRYDLVMDVNVRGAFLASQAAIPHMRENGGHIVMMSPPINPKAAVGKAPYIVSKFGMTMVGMAIDAEESNIAAHALWPITGIRTAATVNLGMGADGEWRTPEILADATVALLVKPAKDSTFHAWLDEEILAEAGVTDFDQYACVPGSKPEPMSIMLVDPDWTPSA